MDDGEFRDYSDPANKEFMQDVKKGVVPKEIEKKFGRNISIGLLDKSQEDFKKPPAPYVAFGGQGVSLGG